MGSILIQTPSNTEGRKAMNLYPGLESLEWLDSEVSRMLGTLSAEPNPTEESCLLEVQTIVRAHLEELKNELRTDA